MNNIDVDCEGNVYANLNIASNYVYLSSSNNSNLTQLTGSGDAHYATFIAKWNNNLEYRDATILNTTNTIAHVRSLGLSTLKNKEHHSKTDVIIDAVSSGSITLYGKCGTIVFSVPGGFVARYDDKLNLINAAQIIGSLFNPQFVETYCEEKLIFDVGNFLGTITILSANPNCNSKQYSFTNTLTTVSNGYITKYNEDLRLCRAVQFGGSSLSFLYIHDSTVDSNGNIYCAGSFTGAVQFGTKSYSSGSSGSSFIAKYSKDLKFCKVALISYYSSGNIFGMEANGDDIYVTGNFTGTAVFDGCTTLTSSSQTGFLAKYSQKKLKLKFASLFGSGAMLTANDIAVDSSSNVYIVGDFTSATATFGCITISGVAGTDVAFVAKAVGGKPKLRARLCCNGIYGKKIRNPFTNFELVKVRVEKGDGKKMIPSLDYFTTESCPRVLRASSDTCGCANCCGGKGQCGKRECAEYVGTAAGKNCLLKCIAYTQSC